LEYAKTSKTKEQGSKWRESLEDISIAPGHKSGWIKASYIKKQLVTVCRQEGLVRALAGWIPHHEHNRAKDTWQAAAISSAGLPA
jgi:hypothetical protein